jgi:hypothetical protein
MDTPPGPPKKPVDPLTRIIVGVAVAMLGPLAIWLLLVAACAVSEVISLR